MGAEGRETRWFGSGSLASAVATHVGFWKGSLCALDHSCVDWFVDVG